MYEFTAAGRLVSARLRSDLKVAAHETAPSAAQNGALCWRPSGGLPKRAMQESLIDLWEAFFQCPRDAVLLDLRRGTLHLGSAELADCFEAVERGIGRIGAPMAAILKPEDVHTMQASVDLASKVGRYFGVFTGPDADQKARASLADVKRVMPPKAPQTATWISYTTRALTRAQEQAKRLR